ncbi:hypothetical protein [Paracoccus cavernae]|uniref:hypothetical protein n=2 Tax=Paracoccus cavernae TaxID=1571207 RepID=UPI0035F2840A
MAKSTAQRQREYRERVKLRDEKANLEVSKSVFRRPFFEFMAQSGSAMDELLAPAGIEAPSFEDDRGPKAFALNGILEDNDEPFFADSVGSLGRAELVVDCLLDATADLAWHIKEYKRTEIKARLAEIEASDLSDPATKKAALKEATRLNKMLDQLDKQVRWTFPQWKVTG